MGPVVGEPLLDSDGLIGTRSGLHAELFEEVAGDDDAARLARQAKVLCFSDESTHVTTSQSSTRIPGSSRSARTASGMRRGRSSSPW